MSLCQQGFQLTAASPQWLDIMLRLALCRKEGLRAAARRRCSAQARSSIQSDVSLCNWEHAFCGGIRATFPDYAGGLLGWETRAFYVPEDLFRRKKTDRLKSRGLSV